MSIRLTDPAIVIAGIKQFGLAPDGSDLRDLVAALARKNTEIEQLRTARDKFDLEAQQLSSENERMRETLEAIEAWSRAYPITVFAEPDLAKAHELLKAGGMTLDAISGSAMRHVVTEVGKMARCALGEKSVDSDV